MSAQEVAVVWKDAMQKVQNMLKKGVLKYNNAINKRDIT